MKNTVTVNGVTLSRAQVEDALKTLNAPELSIENLTHVESKSKNQRGIVLVGSVQQSYVHGRNTEYMPPLIGRYTVVTTGGYGSTYETVEALLKDWTVVS